jgi:hypothetical protein
MSGNSDLPSHRSVVKRLSLADNLTNGVSGRSMMPTLYW